jgi:hypothetical protein
MRSVVKTLKTSLLLLLTLFLLPLAGGCGGGTPDFTVLSAFQGEVLVKKIAASGWANGQIDQKLEKGDIIKSGPDSTTTITFFDGSTLELKPDTQVEITELLKGQGNIILLKQEIGETISTVKKLADPASRYEIETPAAVAAVRGSSMLVRVGPDGATLVQNLEGQISVIAQGVDVPIPVGSASTVQPGQPPAAPIPASPVPVAPSQTDAENDIIDSQGNPTAGQGYQDILGISLVKENSLWVLTINLNGELPSAAEEGVFMEWDLMVDNDNNAGTGWTSAVLFNNIGVDYYLNAYMNGGQVNAGGFLTADTAGTRFTDVQVKATGKTIELRFPPKDIGDSPQFRYIVVSRKYNNSAQPSVLVGADKIPNQGYLTVEE